MAGDLSADTSVLRASGDQLLTFAGSVGAVDGGSLAARQGSYGHAALAAASAGFAGRWTRGLQATAEDITRRGQSLLTVAGTLEDADSNAAAAATALPVTP